MKYEARLVVILSLTFGFVFLDRNAVNYLMPLMITGLHMTNQQVGLVASGLSFTWAIAGFMGGALTDRIGRRKILLMIAVVSFSLCSVLSGLAGSFLMLLFARMLMGLFEGPVLPISLSLVVFESSESRRGRNMGLVTNSASNLLGSCLAPLILVPLAIAYNWRMAFFIAGIPGLVMASIIAIYIREPAVHPVHQDARARPRERMGVVEMLRYRNMWLCMTICVVMVSWLILGWSFLPLLYVRVRHLSATEMSVLMSVLGFAAAFFGFIVPGFSDRVGRRPIVITFCLVGLLAPLAALYFHGSLAMLALLTFLGWSATGTFPLVMATIPSETIPARYVATSLGMVMGLGEILGGVTAPMGAGWAADRYGQTVPIMIEAACAVTAAVLALFLKETAPARVRVAASAQTVPKLLRSI